MQRARLEQAARHFAAARTLTPFEAGSRDLRAGEAAAVRPLGDSVRGRCAGAPQPYEFCMLPLSADGATVTGMISVEDYGALSLLERGRVGKVKAKPPHG